MSGYIRLQLHAKASLNNNTVDSLPFPFLKYSYFTSVSYVIDTNCTIIYIVQIETCYNLATVLFSVAKLYQFRQIYEVIIFKETTTYDNNVLLPQQRENLQSLSQKRHFDIFSKFNKQFLDVKKYETALEFKLI